MEASLALPQPAQSPQALARRPPPGDLAMWVFILAELSAFAVFFVLYGVARMKNVALFDEMQLTLDRRAGAINTALLITASWCVARAVAAIRVDASAASARWLLAGIVAGGGFLVVKVTEYAAKFAAGVGLDTNLFYMFYLSLTFFHFMHVILGLTILLFVWHKTRKGGYCAADHHGMETGASYWHMVDLVWIVLFPLVYVLR
ncbi:MAG TPA: cytochrome c oxidase subunit 3 family protein [Rhodocyclaceae bacterium]|nr:cytochrome c oxidase subunit 3 family protein [Rhodocyclaceae bacterium]